MVWGEKRFPGRWRAGIFWGEMRATYEMAMTVLCEEMQSDDFVGEATCFPRIWKSFAPLMDFIFIWNVVFGGRHFCERFSSYRVAVTYLNPQKIHNIFSPLLRGKVYCTNLFACVLFSKR